MPVAANRRKMRVNQVDRHLTEFENNPRKSGVSATADGSALLVSLGSAYERSVHPKQEIIGTVLSIIFSHKILLNRPKS